MKRLTEAVDGDGALAVVLHNLVGSGLGTSALDHGVAVSLDGESVLTDIDPPDVLDGAGSLAVDTLNLVLADDGVLQGTAGLDGEDGIRVTALILTSALDTTAVGLHATVKGARDDVRRLVGDGALGGWDGESGTLVQVEACRSGGSRASGDGGHEGGDGGSDGDGELHFVGWLVGTLKVERRVSW